MSNDTFTTRTRQYHAERLAEQSVRMIGMMNSTRHHCDAVAADEDAFTDAERAVYREAMAYMRTAALQLAFLADTVGGVKLRPWQHAALSADPVEPSPGSSVD